MNFSSKHTYIMVYTRGNSRSRNCVIGARPFRGTPGASGRCVFPDVGSNKCGRSVRNYCDGMSCGGLQNRGIGIYNGLDRGPSGRCYACGPLGGFGCGSICFEHLGGGKVGICKEAPLFSCDEKMTMQNLNGRLAAYLDKVQYLEEENAQLKCKIRKWPDLQGPVNDPKDYSSWYEQTEDLKKQIICATMDSSKLVLDIHNNQLTADDFKMKYEAELVIHQTVEADISSLRQVLDQLILCRADLEAKVEALQEELCCLKKNHKEEVKLLKNQATENCNVEVNSESTSNLQKVLDDVRRQYEAIIEKNCQEVEKWYESQMEAINRSKEIKDGNKQVADLKHQIHTLEINLQAQLSLRDALQGSLTETQCRCNDCVAEIQNQISHVEQQLEDLRAEIERLNQEYRKMLNAKCLLEEEIEAYRSLLEGDHHGPEQTEENIAKSATLT